MSQTDLCRRGTLYIGIASTLAIARIAALLYLAHRMTSHTVTDAVRTLEWFLYPEALLVAHTALSQMRNGHLYLFVFAVILAGGSFVFALPVLLFKRPNRGSEPGGLAGSEGPSSLKT